GRYFAAGAVQTTAQVAKFSQRDAERLEEYSAKLERIADVLRALVLETPPNLVEGDWRAALGELLHAGRLARRIGKLDLPMRQHLLKLFASSAGDYLDEWFESDPIKALYGFDAIVGNYASPYAAGSAYVMLHHAFGEVNGRKGAWGHAIGGMGAITQAMAAAARAAGADITTGDGAREIIVENGRACGVVLDSGATIRAATVASNVNPTLLYTRLMPQGSVPQPFLDRIKRWRNGSGTFRINVA